MRAASSTEKARVSDDGLRYRSKPSGSQFQVSAVHGHGVRLMSCFRCGTHKQRELLESKRLFGTTQYVCKPSEPCNRGLRAAAEA